MILKLALLSDVLDDYLVTVLLALIADLTPADTTLERSAILSLPFDFQWIGAVPFDGVA